MAAGVGSPSLDYITTYCSNRHHSVCGREVNVQLVYSSHQLNHSLPCCLMEFFLNIEKIPQYFTTVPLCGLIRNNPIKSSTSTLVLLVQWVSTHKTHGYTCLTSIKHQVLNSNDLMTCMVHAQIYYCMYESASLQVHASVSLPDHT